MDLEGRSLGPLPRFPMNGLGFNLLQQAAMRRQGLGSDFPQDGLQAPEFNKNLFETQDTSENIRFEKLKFKENLHMFMFTKRRKGSKE